MSGNEQVLAQRGQMAANEQFQGVLRGDAGVPEQNAGNSSEREVPEDVGSFQRAPDPRKRFHSGLTELRAMKAASWLLSVIWTITLGWDAQGDGGTSRQKRTPPSQTRFQGAM